MSFKDSSPWLKEVFMLIDSVCLKMGIRVYLIGAQARDIYLAELGINPGRKTMDIDFAIMLPDIETYDKVVENLIQAGFSKAIEPYRIIHDKSGSVVDLLPFGEIEEERTVKFTDRHTELSVIGLKEVLEEPILKNIDDKTTIEVAPLEGIIILKLISFDERPERTKDLDYIHSIHGKLL